MADIVAIVGDTHPNSTLGLCGSSIALDDGGTYTPSPAQKWLRRNFIDFADKVKQTSDKHGGAPITVVFNGDTVEADTKRRSNQVITRNKSTILKIATEAHAPLIDIAQRAFFIRGTGAHTGKSAEYEEELAKDCTIAEKCGDQYSWWQFYGEFSGVYFDIAHHATMGSLPWNRTNPLNTLAIRLMLEYSGRKLPDVAVRSHNHKYGCTGDNYPVMVVADPAWQLKTEYINRLGIVETASVGGLIFTCDKGQYTWEKILYKPEPMKPWKASQNKTSS